MRRRPHLVTVCLLVALVYAAIVGVVRASRTAFWFDEVATAIVSDLGVHRIWTALAAGADGNPPLFYYLEVAARRLVADPHVAYRLAPLCGFLGIPLALYVFVRRRSGELAAAAAASISFISPLFTVYSIEARPYTLMTCAVAWAMVAWQGAERRWSALLLGLTLVTASALHYYAVLGIIPLALAEMARTVRLHELRKRIWLALLVGPAPIAAFWPLLSTFREDYGAGFWGQTGLLTSYAGLLGVTDRWSAAIVFVLIAVLLLPTRLTPMRSARTERGLSDIPVEEKTLVVGFACLPAIASVVSFFLHSPTVPRYVLPTVLGVSAAAAFAASGIGRGATIWLLVTTTLIAGVQHSDFWRYGDFWNSTPRHDDVRIIQRFVERHPANGLPIVVSNALSYLGVAYYTRSDASRPVYVADLTSARRFVGTDTSERALLRLAPFGPLHLRQLPEFLEQHSSFLIVAEGGGNEAWDWLPRRLVEAGYDVRLLGVDNSAVGRHWLYRVDRR